MNELRSFLSSLRWGTEEELAKPPAEPREALSTIHKMSKKAISKNSGTSFFL